MAGKTATLVLFLSFYGSSEALEVTATSGQGRVVVRCQFFRANLLYIGGNLATVVYISFMSIDF